MIDIEPMPAGGSATVPAVRDRPTERHVLALGLGLSGAFMLAAIAVAAVTVVGGGATWAAIHLALAGAAATAIGTFMPHFAITLAGTRPEPAAQRLAGIGLIAVGGAAVVLGVTVLGGAWAAAGALSMISGLGFTAWQTVAPLRSPLARRHPIVTASYLVAIAQLAAGVALGGMAAIGVDAVTAAWATLRPAHAWLTLFGAVSLTIFGTLVYLAPTILGARIRPTRSLVVGTIGILGGPLVASLGFAGGSAGVATAGAALTAAGALGQVGYVIDVIQRRGRYTSEHDWRRVAVWHLSGGTGWFALAAAVALLELIEGRSVAAWSLGPLAIPLVAGWMLQELVASWTHLAPSVTPGDPPRHAAQRRVLAGGSRLRPLAWNAGVGAAWAGAAAGIPVLAGVGAAVFGAVAVTSVVMLLRALTIRRY